MGKRANRENRNPAPRIYWRRKTRLFLRRDGHAPRRRAESFSTDTCAPHNGSPPHTRRGDDSENAREGTRSNRCAEALRYKEMDAACAIRRFPRYSGRLSAIKYRDLFQSARDDFHSALERCADIYGRRQAAGRTTERSDYHLQASRAMPVPAEPAAS